MTLQSAGNQYGQINVNGGVAHIGNQYVALYQDQQQECRRQWLQILSSLRHDEINARYNEISDAGHETFGWIYDGGEHSLNDHSSLSVWLSDSTPTFLIQGKAGSGKSTLMKFIFEHNSTKLLLQTGNDQRPPMLLFHSFWIVGTKEQHNLRGLLASLIHQILSERIDLVSLSYHIPRSELKKNLNDWSVRDLRHLLLVLCGNLGSKLCLFIDGLDELDPRDDFDRLVELITEIQHSSSASKFCLSSRPLPYILQNIGEVPGLRLQELTKNDIHNHVRHTLQYKAARCPNTAEKMSDLDLITRLICRKAEGVFLWVHYVLRNVCDGLRIGDDLRALQHRISLLPSAMGGLYQHMWNLQNNDNRVHAKETSMIFAFGRHFPMPVFQLHVALQPALISHYLSKMSPLSPTEISLMCDDMAKHLYNRSAGLIECIDIESEDHDARAVEDFTRVAVKSASSQSLELWRRKHAQYIHRTVYDFLDESMEGQQILATGDPPTVEEVDHMWLQSRIAYFIESTEEFSVQAIYDLCFSPAWLSQRDCGLIDVIDAMGGHLARRKAIRQLSNDCYNWVFEMRDDRAEYFHTDFPGLVAGNSQQCLRHLLSTRGQDWSPYYKGYLALCTIVHVAWNFEDSGARIPTMYGVLRDLKQAGADLVTPHPYVSSMIGVLAIRSPTVRLLLEICVTILNSRYHRIGIDKVSQFLDILGDICVGAEKFTIFWAIDYGKSFGEFGLSPASFPCCMLIFDAAAVIGAVTDAMQGTSRYHNYDDYSIGPGSPSTSGLRQYLQQILAPLVETIWVMGYASDARNNQSGFAKATAEQSAQLLDLVFRDGEPTALYQMTFSYTERPSWPNSDLDFEDRCEDFIPFIEPLDPYIQIGPHDWVEKGCLKRYFATRKRFRTAAASVAATKAHVAQ